MKAVYRRLLADVSCWSLQAAVESFNDAPNICSIARISHFCWSKFERASEGVSARSIRRIQWRADGFRPQWRTDGFSGRADGFRAHADGFRARTDGERALTASAEALMDSEHAAHTGATQVELPPD